MKKKVIKIAHLYYDLMNLYGESGNVKALKRFVERQGVDAEIHFLTVGDKIDFYAYDIYYMGMGSEENQKIVLEDIMQYKRPIRDAVDDNKMFIITGNAMELFGRIIRQQDGSNLQCLNTFSFHSKQENRRLVSDIFYEFDKLPEGKGRNIIAFRNTFSNIMNNGERMFEFSNNVNRNNFFGMIFFGPVLIRNPYFTDYLLEIVFKEKGYDYTPCEDEIEYKAYNEFVDRFIIHGNLD